MEEITMNFLKKVLTFWKRLVRFLARFIGCAALTLGIFIYATSNSLWALILLAVLAVITFFMWWPAMVMLSALSVVGMIVLHERMFVITAVTYAVFAVFGAIASRARTEARVARRLARKAARIQN